MRRAFRGGSPMRLRIVTALIGISLFLAACSPAGSGSSGGSAPLASKRSQPEIAAAPGQSALGDSTARVRSDAAQSAGAPASAPAESAASSSEVGQVSAPRLDRMIVANINL